jgi:broad specificity phosphatase PhoE
MKLYLVRHGNTDSLDNKIHQSFDTPLNNQGIKQANALAKRLKDEYFDLIISSSLIRAKQTAEIIGKKYEESDLFIERKKPSEIVGKSKNDPVLSVIWNKIEEMYIVNRTWRYSDEENFEDLKLRGKKALAFLLAQKKEKILVISHGAFIGVLFGLMVDRDRYDGKMFMKLDTFLRMNNTGISIFNHDEKKGWSIESWNDRSHWME